MIGVIGGCGGVGSSSFAAALALVAAPSLLVDLQRWSGGVDVLLGIEATPGARWSGLRLAGGRLDPAQLRAGLPTVGGCAVLAADSTEVDPAAVVQVVTTARASGAVVIDVPGAADDLRAAALGVLDFAVLLARADVAGLVAARAAAAALGDVPAGVVVRRGDVGAAEAARLVGLPLLGELPVAGRGAPDVRRPARAVVRVAAGVLAGVPGDAA